MPEENVTRTEFNQFVKHAEKEHTMYERKLDKVDEIVETTIKMASNIENISNKVSKIGDVIRKVEERMDKIEREPMELVKTNQITIKRACWAAIATALTTSALWIFVQSLSNYIK